MNSPNLKPGVYSLSFWKAYTIQMRPYLFFVSGIAGAVGISMAKEANTPWWKMLLAFIPFFLGYGFGQALTDCFQTDTDKLSAPYRPLSNGTLTIRSVLAVSITGLIGSALLFYQLHILSLLLSIIAVFGLATYSYVKKHFCLGGPFYNASIVALLPVMGYFSVSGPTRWHFPSFLYAYLAITFFSYAIFVLMGYLKDIDADRTTNYRTFPVVFGWRKTVILSDVFALATVALFWSREPKNNVEIILGLLGLGVLIAGQTLGHLSKLQNERDALFPIVSTVRSFVLFHLAILLHFQPHWWKVALIYYLVFEVALFLRPAKFQV